MYGLCLESDEVDTVYSTKPQAKAYSIHQTRSLPCPSAASTDFAVPLSIVAAADLQPTFHCSIYALTRKSPAFGSVKVGQGAAVRADCPTEDTSPPAIRIRVIRYRYFDDAFVFPAEPRRPAAVQGKLIPAPALSASRIAVSNNSYRSIMLNKHNHFASFEAESRRTEEKQPHNVGL
jgi:hypothetical protein